jgi:hypothetical protein
MNHERIAHEAVHEKRPHIGQMNSRPSVGQILNTVWYARAIHVAVQLNIADMLKDGCRSIKDLAAATGTHADSLSRFMRALASIDIFSEAEPGFFTNTNQSCFLQSDHPSSFYHLARFLGCDWNWQTWGAMLYSIQTGKPAFDHIYGMTIWEYFATKDPEGEKIFNAVMTAYSTINSVSIARAYDFSSVQTVADIGGGQGLLLKTILQTYPMLQGYLVDRPQVIDQARASLQAAGLHDRCECVASDILAHIPVQADVYLLKNILHDWDDRQAIHILCNCRRSIPSGGKLLVAERVLQTGTADPLGMFLDLQMLLKMQGGKERTETEYRALFAASGFSLSRIILVSEQLSLVEGVIV